MTAELRTKSDVSIVLIFFSVLAVLGVAAGGFVVQDYARARASASWPAYDAIVLSQLDADNAKVRYVYSVNGRSYESTRERVFTASFLKEPSPDYLPGETIEVYVNPQDHGYAVLYTGGAGLAFILFSVLSGACIFFGVGGIVWTLSHGAGQEMMAAA